jgi:hypothetical protein
MAPNVPNGGRSTAHAEKIGNTLYHGDRKVQMGLEAQTQQWVAPRVNEFVENPSTREARLAQIDPSDRPGAAGSLTMQATQWPGPSAGNFNDGEDLGSFDARKARQKAKGINGNDMGDSLAIAAARASENWPAPAARDHKGSSPDSVTRQDGKSRADMLDFAAEQFFHPPSSPAQPMAAGAMSSTAGPNSNQPSAKRRLNPIFVEALMRWPTGLSGFERQETAWTRWWLLMPSFVSTLCSQKPADQGRLL